MNNPFIVTGGSDHFIKIWDARTGGVMGSAKLSDKTVPAVNPPPTQVNVVRLSGDNKYVFAGGNPVVKIYDTAKGLTFRGQLLHSKNVTDIGLIPQMASSSLTFTSAEDYRVRLWDIRTSLSAIAEFPHTNPVNAASVALLPSGPVIVSGTQDGKLYAWDVQSRRKLYEATMFDGRSIGVGVRSVGSHGPYVVFANSFGDLYINKMGPTGFEHVLGVRAHCESIMRIRTQKDKDSSGSSTPTGSGRTTPLASTQPTNIRDPNKLAATPSVYSALTTSTSRFRPNAPNMIAGKISHELNKPSTIAHDGTVVDNDDRYRSSEEVQGSTLTSQSSSADAVIDKENAFNFVTSSLDGTGCSWYFNGREVKKTMEVYHKGCVWDGCLSRDGKTLVTCSSDRSALLSRGAVQRKFMHDLAIHSVAFSEE